MQIVDGMPVFTEAEQDLICAAEDDMTVIKQIKDDFFALADSIRAKANLYTGTDKYLKPGDYETGIITMEQALDDMLSAAWHDATERAYSSESLPQSKVYTRYYNMLRKAEAEIADKFPKVYLPSRQHDADLAGSLEKTDKFEKIQFPDVTKFLKGE